MKRLGAFNASLDCKMGIYTAVKPSVAGSALIILGQQHRFTDVDHVA